MRKIFFVFHINQFVYIRFTLSDNTVLTIAFGMIARGAIIEPELGSLQM